MALQEGQALDPNVLVPMRVIGHWAARVWQGSIPMDRVEAYWEAKGGQELSVKCQIMRAVKGPIGAFLQHAAQIGWEVIGPSKVRDREGQS